MCSCREFGQQHRSDHRHDNDGLVHGQPIRQQQRRRRRRQDASTGGGRDRRRRLHPAPDRHRRIGTAVSHRRHSNNPILVQPFRESVSSIILPPARRGCPSPVQYRSAQDRHGAGAGLTGHYRNTDDVSGSTGSAGSRGGGEGCNRWPHAPQVLPQWSVKV